MAFWRPGQDAPEKLGEKKQTNTDDVTKKPPPPILLSKSVMSMKFMKRKEEHKVENESYHAKPETMQTQQIDDAGSMMEVDEIEASSSSKYRKDDTDMYQHLPGRRSFGGINKAVETYYSKVFNQNTQRESVKERTISDQEMLDRYENLIGLPRGPSQGKRPEVQKGKSATVNNSAGSSNYQMTVIKPNESQSGVFTKRNNGTPSKRKQHKDDNNNNSGGKKHKKKKTR